MMFAGGLFILSRRESVRLRRRFRLRDTLGRLDSVEVEGHVETGTHESTEYEQQYRRQQPLVDKRRPPGS